MNENSIKHNNLQHQLQLPPYHHECWSVYYPTHLFPALRKYLHDDTQLTSHLYRLLSYVMSYYMTLSCGILAAYYLLGKLYHEIGNYAYLEWIKDERNAVSQKYRVLWILKTIIVYLLGWIITIDLVSSHYKISSNSDPLSIIGARNNQSYFNLLIFTLKISIILLLFHFFPCNMRTIGLFQLIAAYIILSQPYFRWAFILTITTAISRGKCIIYPNAKYRVSQTATQQINLRLMSVCDFLATQTHSLSYLLLLLGNRNAAQPFSININTQETGIQMLILVPCLFRVYQCLLHRTSHDYANAFRFILYLVADSLLFANISLSLDARVFATLAAWVCDIVFSFGWTDQYIYKRTYHNNKHFIYRPKKLVRGIGLTLITLLSFAWMIWPKGWQQMVLSGIVYQSVWNIFRIQRMLTDTEYQAQKPKEADQIQ